MSCPTVAAYNPRELIYKKSTVGLDSNSQRGIMYEYKHNHLPKAARATSHTNIIPYFCSNVLCLHDPLLGNAAHTVLWWLVFRSSCNHAQGDIILTRRNWSPKANCHIEGYFGKHMLKSHGMRQNLRYYLLVTFATRKQPDL